MQANFIKNGKVDYKKGILLLSLVVIFMVIFLVAGVRAYPDTESYLKMSPIRDPGYVFLLKATVALFSRDGFWVLGFLQNLLAILSIYLTAVYIDSKFEENYVRFLVTLCLLLPYVVTPLFASSGIFLTNAMISEGITLSLYNLYFLFLLKAVWGDNEKKALGISLIFAFLLSITRGQMMVTMIAWLIVAVWLGIKKRGIKQILGAILSVLLVFGCRFLVINGYHYIANGMFAGTTYGDVTILSNVIYVSDRTDGESIQDEKLRQLFFDIYDEVEQGGMLFANAPEDFSSEADFFSVMHDRIKDSAIYPTLQDYVKQEEHITDYMKKCVAVDGLASGMYKELLATCFGRWFMHYLGNMAVGFIRTVAIVSPFFNVPTLVGYLFLILARIYLYRKDRDNRAVKMLGLTALLTVGNVAAVALTIMCLSRYMIYNMALVYISALLVLKELFHTLKRLHPGEMRLTQ